MTSSPPTIAPNEKLDLPTLTGLRFFAAMWVVLYHQSGPAGWLAPTLEQLGPSIANVVRCGYVAVSGFFILSGFILAANYAPRRFTTRQFLTARFGRIYPVYFLGLLLMLPLEFAKNAHAAPEATQRFIGAFSLCTLLVQAWHPVFALAINSPGWSLSVEAFFYATFPFLLRSLARLSTRRLLFIAGACTLASVVAPIIMMVVAGTDVAANVPGKVTILRNFLGFDPLLRLPEFVLGAALGCWFLRSPPWSAARARLAKAISIGVIVAVTGLFAGSVPRLLMHNGLLAVPFALLIVGVAMSNSSGNWMARRTLVRLGKASYAIYVLHWAVFHWAERIVPEAHRGLACFVLCAAVIVALSLFVEHFIESPARRMICQALRRSPRDETPCDSITIGAIPSAS